MGNLFASTGLGDEKPHERDVEYCGFAGRRLYERQNENPETPAVHNYMGPTSFYGARAEKPHFAIKANEYMSP